MTLPAAFPDDAPHLLVVDDDRRIRDLLSRFLTGEGYRVSTAETATDVPDAAWLAVLIHHYHRRSFDRFADRDRRPFHVFGFHFVRKLRQGCLSSPIDVQ